MDGKEICRDLLELEHKNPSSSSSAIDSTLLVCKEKKKKKKKREEAPSKPPTIAPLPKSQFLDIAKSFLGVMAESNKKLEEESKDNSEAFYIEEVTGEEENQVSEEVTGDKTQVVEMDLVVGVAELKTQEAVNAAEVAIAGHNVVTQSGDSDESDSGDEEEEKGSSGEQGFRKRTRIIELS